MLEPSGDVVTAAKECEHVWQEMRRMTAVRTNKRQRRSSIDDRVRPVFPFTAPVSATLGNLTRAAHVQHCVFEKTDGYHFALLLTTYQGRAQGYMVPRNMAVYRVSIAGPLKFFEGTLFEGELISKGKSGRMLYYIFRTLWLSGADVRDRTFLDRQYMASFSMAKVPKALHAAVGDMGHDAFSTFVKTEVREGHLISVQPGLVLGVKRPYPVKDLLGMWAKLGKYSDGVILVPNVPHYQVQRGQYPELKLKHHHTLDFVFRGTMVHAAKGVMEYQVLYSCGGVLVNALQHMMVAGEHVKVKVVDDKSTTAGRNFVRWKRELRRLSEGAHVDTVVECHVEYRALSDREVLDANEAARAFFNKQARAQLGKHLEELGEPRTFRHGLFLSFLKVRTDKTKPNALTTIVSTLLQSKKLTVEKAYSILTHTP